MAGDTPTVYSEASQSIPRSTDTTLSQKKMAPTSVVSPSSSEPIPRSTKTKESIATTMSFTNPAEMWDLITKQIDAEKLNSLRSFGQDTLTKGVEVGHKLSEKANIATQSLMTTASAHPYAFVMTLMLSGVASLFVGSFLLLIGVWVMILAGVLASFCMVGLAVFAVVLMTTWGILFTLVSAGTAVYMPYLLYMGLEAGWGARVITSVKETTTKTIEEAKRLSKQAADIVIGEGLKRLQ